MLSKLFTGVNLFLLSMIVAGAAIFVFIFLPNDGLVNGGRDKVVKIYYADNISPAHKQVIDDFNRMHTGRIEVIPIDLPFSKFSTNERKELLARALRSKNSRVDVFAVDLIWAPRFARWAEPLDQFLTTNLQIDFLNYALESCYYEGRLVALPLYLDIGLMYYQRDLLQDLFPDFESIERKLRRSITWEEMIALGKDKKPPLENFYLFAGDNFEGLVCTFMELVLSQNPNFFATELIQLNAPESRKALQLLVDLVHKHNLTPLDITEFDEYETNLYALRNKGLFWRGWPGLSTHFRDVAEFTGKLGNVRIAAVPHFKGGKPVSVFGGWNLMVSRQTKHREEALQFLRFFMRKESQMTMYKEGGYPPILKEVYLDATLIEKNPELAYYYDLLKNGAHRPFRPDYTKWSDVISYYVHQAINKELTVTEALTAATEIINSKKVLVR